MWATGKTKPSSGFSLIELLVVLTILGLATATISLSLNTKQDPTSELKPLLAKLQAAQQWAMWSRQTVVVQADKTDVRFISAASLADQEWATQYRMPNNLYSDPHSLKFVASGLNPPQALKVTNGTDFIELRFDARNRASISRVSP